MKIKEVFDIIGDTDFKSKTIFSSDNSVFIINFPDVINIIVFDDEGEKHLIKINANIEDVLQISVEV